MSPHRDDPSALDVLQDITDVLLTRGRPYVSDSTAAVVKNDPGWLERECTRRHVSLLWRGLQRAVTNEIGSGLGRYVDDWDDDAPDPWAPRIVIAEPDEFVDYEDDAPWGWRPLADAHKREAGWDFAPQPESGVWLGSWEPERVTGTEQPRHVTGTLTGFVVVGRDGDLRFVHVVRSRRGAGTARRLVEHAIAHHGLGFARGPFTEDGEAFVAAVGLPLTPPERD